MSEQTNIVLFWYTNSKPTKTKLCILTFLSVILLLIVYYCFVFAVALLLFLLLLFIPPSQ